MKISSKDQAMSNRRTITVVADCMLGALDAARFAVRNLLDKEAEILLLQTFQKPKFGQSLLRNLSPMLRKIANEELYIIKDKLIKEYDVSADQINLMVLEGQLPLILKLDCLRKEDQSYVIGIGPETSSRKISCWKTITSLVDSDVRPLFIVSDEITLIEKKRIIHFSGQDTHSSHEFMDFLEGIREKKELAMHHPTPSKKNLSVLSPETILHFKSLNGQVFPGMTESESILRNEIKQFSI